MEEVRIRMPEQLDFIRKERKKLKSAWHEIANRRTGLCQTSAKTLIQRVPPVIHRVKVDFTENFEPVQKALGPLHHGNSKLKLAEQTKLELAARFVFENETTDETLFHKIKAEIEDLRKCYNQEDIKDYDDDKLAWMFFVDGCALLTTLYSIYRWSNYNEVPDSGIYLFDLLLLENQLPYRVLKILIDSTRDPPSWEQSISDFLDIIITYRHELIGSKHGEKEEEERQDYVHLLDRLRTKLLTGDVEESNHSMIGSMILHCGDSRKDWKTFHGFKELKQSGIRVRPSKTNNIQDISFHCNFLGCLKMPPLVVNGLTASKFMNLVALEMCPDFKNDFGVSSYLCFLGSLIQTAEDVKELRVAGMLHNYYGNDERVADLFRRMSRDLLPASDMYKIVREDINRYCNSWVIWMYSHYFSRNWSFLAFSGAIAGLVLSLVQTYFTVNQKK